MSDFNGLVALNNALDLKANIASPSFTGIPIAPTAADGTNTTQLATTAFVTTAVASGGAGGSSFNANVANIAIGTLAGVTSQGLNSVAIGRSAGNTTQGSNSVAIGSSAGQTTQRANSIAIGSASGYDTQGASSVAIGLSAGQSTQGASSVAIGNSAGSNTQAAGSVAIGWLAAQSGQAVNSVAIGQSAGQTNQAAGSIALGFKSGQTSQGASSIALGSYAGQGTQGANSVAIGSNAGKASQGIGSIAIGYNAGITSQVANSIILGNVASAETTGLFINPVRSVITGTNSLTYDTLTNEISYNTTKTFVINHPLDQNKYLIHACLEGPEAGVYYRGTGTIENNISTTIVLPEYVSNIAKNFTVHINKIYDDNSLNNFDVLVPSRVANNSFTVYGTNGSFYWAVYGERQAIEVEVDKSLVQLNNFGPYTYLVKK